MLRSTYCKRETGPEAVRHWAAGKVSGPQGEPLQQIDELGPLSRLPRAVVGRVLPYLTGYGDGERVDSSSEAPQR